MAPQPLRAAAVLAAIATVASPVAAQETRATLLEQQRAEKASRLEAYKPGRLEKLLLYVENEKPLEKIQPHNGFFVQYGYTAKPLGAGIGFGGGYRHDLFDRTARVELESGITFRNYQLVRADFSLPYLADERLEIGVEGAYRHNPQDDYYGSGADSLEDNRVSYRLDTTDVQGRAIVRPRGWLEIGTRFGRISPSIGRGTDSRYPSIEALFTDEGAPGLATQPDFRYAGAFATIDYRDQRGNARNGGLYSFAWRSYSDLGAGSYGFTRTDIRLQQFLPIFDKKRVFAVQARLMATSPGDGQLVPFYFQPTVGGNDSIRSYSDYRFRDNHAMYFNAEYRWEAFSPLDMALFTDWGKVAPKAGDLNFRDLKRAYGIGFRLNSYKNVFARFDIATGGGEGLRVHVKFNKAF